MGVREQLAPNITSSTLPRGSHSTRARQAGDVRHGFLEKDSVTGGSNSVSRCDLEHACQAALHPSSRKTPAVCHCQTLTQAHAAAAGVVVIQVSLQHPGEAGLISHLLIHTLRGFKACVKGVCT